MIVQVNNCVLRELELSNLFIDLQTSGQTRGHTRNRQEPNSIKIQQYIQKKISWTLETNDKTVYPVEAKNKTLTL